MNIFLRVLRQMIVVMAFIGLFLFVIRGSLIIKTSGSDLLGSYYSTGFSSSRFFVIPIDPGHTYGIKVFIKGELRAGVVGDVEDVGSYLGASITVSDDRGTIHLTTTSPIETTQSFQTVTATYWLKTPKLENSNSLLVNITLRLTDVSLNVGTVEIYQDPTITEQPGMKMLFFFGLIVIGIVVIFVIVVVGAFLISRREKESLIPSSSGVLGPLPSSESTLPAMNVTQSPKATMTSTCPQCGVSTFPEDKFCSNCGYLL